MPTIDQECSPGYTLSTYLSDKAYTRDDGAPLTSYDAVCETIAPPGIPRVIAVDGPTTSGKTSLSDSLRRYYSQRGVPVAYLPLDYFLVDRAARTDIARDIESGKITIAEYSYAAWEQEKYREALLVACQIVRQEVAGSHELVIPNVYNRITGSKEDDQTIAITVGGIVLTEGVGLHTYHASFFDTCIRADVQDDSVLLERSLARERQKLAAIQLSDDFLRWRYNLVDGPHSEFLRASSVGRADIVVDTSELDSMVIFRKVMK